MVMMTDRRTATAFHEACHIVANAAVGLAPIAFASIVRTGHVIPTPDNYDCRRFFEFSAFSLHDIRAAPLPEVINGKPVSARTAVLLYAKSIMLLSAGDAVRRMFPGHDGGDHTDIEASTFYSGRVTADVDKFLDCARIDGARIIRESISKVEAIAAALLVHGQLDGAEIAAILSGRCDAVQRTRWRELETSAKRFTILHGDLRVL
jgi:hypothetical protein